MEENKTIGALHYQHAWERRWLMAVEVHTYLIDAKGTNDLWYIIPYHLHPNNTRNIPMVYTHTRKRRYTSKYL